MLFARSSIVTVARAFNLRSIDMVCVNYQDNEELGIESREGRTLGFDGKVSTLCYNDSTRRLFTSILDSLASDSSFSSRYHSIVILSFFERYFFVLNILIDNHTDLTRLLIL